MAKVSDGFFQNVNVGVASLLFGVALSIYVYAVTAGKVSGISSWLLFLTSFLLLFRFWWRHVSLFVRLVPSHTFWQFSFDFIIAFLGVIAVFYVYDLRVWALIGSGLMIASIVRCVLALPGADSEVKKKIKQTIVGAVIFFVFAVVLYLLSSFVSELYLAIAIFAVTAVFVVYSSKKG